MGQVSVRVVLESDHLHEEIHGQGLQGPIFPDSRSFASERFPEFKFCSRPVLGFRAGLEVRVVGGDWFWERLEVRVLSAAHTAHAAHALAA